MSWNGSDRKSNGNANENLPRNPAQHRQRWYLYLLGGLIAAIGLIILAFIFVDSKGGAVVNDDPRISPGKSIPSIEKDVVCKTVEATNTAPVRSGKKLNYAALAAMGKVVITNKNGRELVMTPRKDRKRPKTSIFTHSSENRIACYMRAEPGTRFYGTQRFGKQFLDDFMKSCEEPIIVTADDDEYTRELKRDMTKLKIELRNRMAEGEDLCQLMADTHQELQRMGVLKNQIEKSMKDAIKSSAKSEADVDDFIAAANQMLEKQGIAPIKVNPIIKHSLMRSAGLETPPLTEADISVK